LTSHNLTDSDHSLEAAEARPAKIMSTGDFDDLLLDLEDADEVFTDEMIFDFRTGQAFSLGC
jgi:hypothetical protein